LSEASAPVAIVTGASRGAGKGIATALGSHGCIVYVTGRSAGGTGAAGPGTIYETAEAVTAAGGKGIAVQCDHADDQQVAELFARVEREQGKIDMLVNNAAAITDALHVPGNFWEKPVAIGDMINVGVRSGFVASWHAAPIMVKQRRGLIVFTSSPGAVHYCFGPAYGAHKAGMDKMAADMAVDFADTGVAALSLWMGALATERLLAMIDAEPAKYGHLPSMLETPEYTGHVIWELWNDAGLTSLSGQTLIGAELGRRYGITRPDGSYPPSARDTHKVEPRVQYPVIIR
jgi:NAD(P)-dependent dehydrogenase (short-subunit alcohol dehydrogenase family)